LVDIVIIRNRGEGTDEENQQQKYTKGVHRVTPGSTKRRTYAPLHQIPDGDA
jgi:hypothetical protein